MQCRAISSCAEMFGCKQKTESKRVLECLQKCLKITDAVNQSDPKECGLWVEMLDRYVFFIESGCEEIALKFVDSLLNLCNEHISFAENADGAKEQSAKARNHLNHSK